MADINIGTTEKPLYVPEGSEAEKNYQTNIKSNIEAGRVSAAGTPLGLPGDSSVIGSSDRVRTGYENLGGDITKGLAQFGINEPTSNLDQIIKDSGIQDVTARREQLAGREKEDTALIEKSFATAKGEQQLAQEEALGKAEGRTRIGGFITKMETDDIQKLQRGFRLESAALEGNRQQALQAARRAYQDQDYQAAKDQLQLAKDIEKDIYDKKQDYFQNILRYNAMETPLTRANKATQDFVIESMQKYPSGFKDLETTDLLNMSLKDVQDRILNSDEYKRESSGASEFSIQEVNGRKVRFGFDKAGKVVSKVDLGSGESGAGDLTPAPVAGGQETDPTILAYANQYASTGTIPTNIPKGSFARISAAAKNLPKAPGTLYDTNTGIKSSSVSSKLQEGISELRSAIKKMEDAKELRAQIMSVGFGPERNRLATQYRSLRGDIAETLLRAASGGAVTVQEKSYYEGLVPDLTIFNRSPEVKAQQNIENYKTQLDTHLSTQGLKIAGYNDGAGQYDE